jgi:hypothetical protein
LTVAPPGLTADRCASPTGAAVNSEGRKPWDLIYRLSNCGEPTVAQAGGDHDQLRGDRNEADYDLDRPIPTNAPGVSVQLAESIIQTLEAAAQGPTRTQITDAMRVYERDVLGDVTWHP